MIESQSEMCRMKSILCQRAKPVGLLIGLLIGCDFWIDLIEQVAIVKCELRPDLPIYWFSKFEIWRSPDTPRWKGNLWINESLVDIVPTSVTCRVDVIQRVQSLLISAGWDKHDFKLERLVDLLFRHLKMTILPFELQYL